MKKKRLFISTGFYSTLLAAALADSALSGEYDNHLLITLDRQSSGQNILWAWRLFDRWASVDTIDHTHYYVGDIQYEHSVSHFDEVCSPFPVMRGAVSKAFNASKYTFYEEGLTSYQHFLEQQYEQNDFFYSLHPYLFTGCPGLLSLPLPVAKVKEKLQLASQCYPTPVLTGDNNVIMVVTGGFPDELKENAIRNEYLRVIAELSSQGLQVCLLQHTRVQIDEILLAELKNSYLYNVEFININAPITDIFLCNNSHRIKFLVGICSTLLVNSELLFNLKSFSMEADFLNERQQTLAKIQNTMIAPFSECK